jgi:hypothetical protein
MRTRKSLIASRYLGKNTEVIDRSLHLYLIFSFRIYIAILVVCFTFSSLVDRLVDRIILEPRLYNSFAVEIATH